MATWLKKACCTFFMLVVIVTHVAQAQNTLLVEYQVKAAFLFNFTRFVNWPSSSFNQPNAPFVIGILGNDPFGPFLDELVQGEKVGQHPIVIQRCNNLTEALNCQMVYVNTNDPAKIKDIVQKATERNILTVSDADDFTNWGGDVRFFKDGNKIKIEVNIETAKASQLEISSKLLRVARINKSEGIKK